MSKSAKRNNGGRRKKALSYLRVSDPKQVRREYDPEGISLPAQRRANKYKADELDADVVEEFVDPGRSGKTVDKRPEFQRMLSVIKSCGDIDYVIVYALRLMRNPLLP